MKNLNFPGLPRVLVIDSEEGIREGLRNLLQTEGVAIETASTIENAVDRVANSAFDLIFFDVNMPNASGLEALPTLRRSTPAADVVVLTGYGSSSNTVDAMRRGAFDVIEKPFTQDRVLSIVRRCLEMRQLRNELTWTQERIRDLTSTNMIGLSPALRQVQSRIDQVSHSADTPALITGKAGTGKELAARCIHERSSRRHGPFVTINCASLTESALEAELFGYEPNAFAGANPTGKDGLLAAASGGTLYLDEVGKMATSLQAKLVRVLQERTFRRVGGIQDVTVDARIIGSSHSELRSAVEAGTFRDDLYYRLSVMSVEIPTLEERPEDVPLLAHFFLDQIGRQMGKALSGFTEEAMETLGEYAWPGNVRELRNVIEHAAIVCSAGMIDEAHLPTFTGGTPDGSDEISRSSITLDIHDRSIRALEGQLVAKVLEDTQWNISKAAAILGINRTTLYNKIRLHHLGQRPGREKATIN